MYQLRSNRERGRSSLLQPVRDEAAARRPACLPAVWQGEYRPPVPVLRPVRFAACSSRRAPTGSGEIPGPPLIPRNQGPICPACGFENEGENRFYCKQCGAYIRDKSPVRASDAAGGGRRPQSGLIRIKPDGMDAIRQRPVYEPPKAEKQPIARRRKEPPKRTPLPYRKIAIAAAVIIVLILIAMVVPGLLQEKPDTTAAARSLAAGAPADAAAEKTADSPVDSLFRMVQGLLPAGDGVSNQGTTVVKDTSPIP